MKQSFRILTCKPDQRSFRQEEFIMEPYYALLVEVDVPDEYVLFDGMDDGSVITLEGLKWLANHFDSVFMGGRPNKQEFNEVEDDVEWEKP